ncbi:helix-turn-helix domain-containing protein [Chryseobacterium antibioticum]|uniref:Helix-turn-helix domain-containing protein n=1 Tax=Chryseobacterium pyrolae TaxID=2987481 RepID=A0ABT2IKQ9_9FLAO|nr:helix-turn-helix domain-containing protein [Chryseobacterium pyrolae]MCT2409235.1 helix-turn-helix domain-containing protein [Chryseobacterium pyrolae]
MQIQPPEHLSSYIRHYIFLENAGSECKNLRLFTDGSTGLILSGSQDLYAGGSRDHIPSSFFYGQPAGYRDFTAEGSFSMIAVVFQPYFFNIILKISAKEAKNQIISAEDVLKNELLPFQEELLEGTDPQLIISKLNTFFTKFLSGKINSDDELIKAVQQWMLKNKGLVSSKDLEQFTGYSERHLERKFEEYMGLTPKKYGNIIRLHHFINLMKKNAGSESVAGLSYDAGYTDQSHLIKDFKSNIGLTPNQYLKIENKLAINFIELQ